MVPSNCSCLILVCHFLCLFRANSKSWIGWQTKETGWHWAVRVMPSHLLLWCFQVGVRWAGVEKKKNKNPNTNPANCLLAHPQFRWCRYQLTKHKILLENMRGEVFGFHWKAAYNPKGLNFHRDIVLLVEPWGESQMAAPQQPGVVWCGANKGHSTKRWKKRRTSWWHRCTTIIITLKVCIACR